APAVAGCAVLGYSVAATLNRPPGSGFMQPNRGRLRAPPGMGGERSTASVRVGGQPWQALRQRPSATDATRAAVAARRAAWFEDERGAGRRRLATDDLVVQDDDPAIEQFAHVDRQPGVGARATELHHARPEAHGVVAGDHAAVAAAEAEGEIARRPAPHRLAVGGRFPEALIEVGDELGQVGLRGL